MNRTVYVKKEALEQYQIYPIPKNLGDYYAVDIPDDVDPDYFLSDKVYNPNRQGFEISHQIIDERNIARRNEAYMTDAAPLAIAYLYYDLIDDNKNRKKTKQQFIDQVDEINAAYPVSTD